MKEDNALTASFIMDLLGEFDGNEVYYIYRTLLECNFRIEDYYPDNLQEINNLLCDYFHPNDGIEHINSHFVIRNVKSRLAVERLNSMKSILNQSSRVQTFKDGTSHTVYFLCENEVKAFFPEDRNDYVILIHENKYFFVCKNNSNTNILRVIREVSYRSCENKGDIAYHAGGYTIGEKGVLVCGGAATGKTTVILEALKRGAGYLANDRIIISACGQNYMMKYLPLSMRVGIGTIKYTPQISMRITTYPWKRKQEAAVINYPYEDTCVVGQLGSSQKLEITSKEIQDILGVDLVESSHLKAIVFPSIDPNFSGMEVKKCDPIIAASHMMAQCMTPNDDNWPSPWLLARNKSDNELREKAEILTRELTRNVKSYIVRFGLDAYKQWFMDWEV